MKGPTIEQRLAVLEDAVGQLVVPKAAFPKEWLLQQVSEAESKTHHEPGDLARWTVTIKGFGRLPSMWEDLIQAWKTRREGGA